MQMVKVRVRDQNVIDRRQVFDPHARAAKPFQEKKPAGEVGIDQYVLSSGLEKKSRVADEGHSQIAVLGEYRPMYLSQSGLYC